MVFGLDNISNLTAFLAGLASFLTPCVLPLIPVYISYLAGTSVSELTQADAVRAHGRASLLRNGLMFIAGFSTVFVALGAGATEVGRYLLVHLKQAEQIAGVFIVIFALFMLGLIKIPFLQRTFKLQAGSKGIGPLASFGLGFGFAFGWTPCVGPILGSILAIAATGQNLSQGIILLAFYSLGLAAPFLLVLLGAQWALPKMRKLNKYTPWIEKISGGLLLILGLLMATGSFSRISAVLGQ